MSIKPLMFPLVLLLSLGLYAQPHISIQVEQCPSADNNFRGLSAINEHSIWLSSDQGEVWFYHDEHDWENRSPKGYEKIMWRDIHAFSSESVLILSAGSPGLILKTDDAGKSWQEVYRNDSPTIFFDAFDFIGKDGMAFSDAQGELLEVISTEDAGQTWHSLSSERFDLKVIEGQGGFAASGTCLELLSDNECFIVLGGPQAILKKVSSEDPQTIGLPLDHGEASQGPFSISAKNNDSLIVVGGDYRADSLSHKSVSLSTDGGSTWQLPQAWSILENHYWSCVEWKGPRIILCSRFNTAISLDNGQTWEIINIGFYTNHKGWFSGPGGRIGRLKPF